MRPALCRLTHARTGGGEDAVATVLLAVLEAGSPGRYEWLLKCYGGAVKNVKWHRQSVRRLHIPPTALLALAELQVADLAPAQYSDPSFLDKWIPDTLIHLPHRQKMSNF
jgi:hypothetical protein